MAKKYTIKKTDNLLELSQKFGTSPSNILKVNGLQTLTPGQTINVPVLRGFDGVETGAGYETQRGGRRGRPDNTTSLLSYGSEYNRFGAVARSANYAPPVQSDVGSRRNKGGNVNPMLARNPYASITSGAGTGMGFWDSVSGVLSGNVTPGNRFYDPNSFQDAAVSNRSGYAMSGEAGVSVSNNTANLINPRTGGFLSPDAMGGGYTPPVVTGGSLSGDKQGQVPALTAPAVSRAEGRAQFLSGEGINPNSGYIPTRADVWNMKANSRRKKMAKGEGDEGGGGGGYSSAPAVDPTLQNQGNYVNTAVSWRVG